MPKASAIVRTTMTDPDTCARYAATAIETLKLHGTEPLARGRHSLAIEGEGRPRNGMPEAGSCEAALVCHHAPECQAAAAVRKPAGVGEVAIVEGAP